MIIVFIVLALLAGGDAAWHIKHDAGEMRYVPAQSWDQANLKQNDNTCRTMVYHVDPETGLLVQCPPEAQ